MLAASLGLAGLGRPPVVLGLGAHPDDLEIGAGGLLLRLAEQVPAAEPVSVVLTGGGERLEEARAALAAFTAGRGSVRAGGLRDGFLPGDWAATKDRLRDLTEGLRPDLVLAPSPEDAHQDHRLLGELAWQLFRGALVLHYEVPKWDGDLQRLTTYLPLPDDVAERKVALLAEHFPSQAHRPWYDGEVFRSVLRLRGVECGARYAEAYLGRKLVLAP